VGAPWSSSLRRLCAPSTSANASFTHTHPPTHPHTYTTHTHTYTHTPEEWVHLGPAHSGACVHRPLPPTHHLRAHTPTHTPHAHTHIHTHLRSGCTLVQLTQALVCTVHFRQHHLHAHTPTHTPHHTHTPEEWVHLGPALSGACVHRPLLPTHHLRAHTPTHTPTHTPHAHT